MEQLRAGLRGLRKPDFHHSLGPTRGYRIGLRRMFGAASERSRIGAILPPDVWHVDTINVFQENAELL